jgi:hypothetical protein
MIRIQHSSKICTGIISLNYGNLKNLNNSKAFSLIGLQFWGVADIYSNYYCSTLLEHPAAWRAVCARAI